MPHVFADRVQETTTTTGTGALTLLGNSTGFRAFSAVCANGDTAYYAIFSSGGTEWEVGLGTWGTGNILTRTSVISSSNANAAVNFSAGTKNVILTGPAVDVLQLDNNNTINLPLSTTIANSPANTLRLYTQSMAGRVMLGGIGAAGRAYPFQPHIGFSRAVRWTPTANATSTTLDGSAAPTAVGTLTSRTITTTNILTYTKRVGYVSTATAGSLAGHFFGQGQFWIGNGSGLGGFHYVQPFATADAATVSGARAFIGLSSNTAAPTNVEPNTLTNSIGVAQLSTDATQWYIVYGGSAAQTAIALGTAIGAPTLTNTVFDLQLYAPPNSNNTVGYMLTNRGSGVSVSGTLTGVAGTALPASTTALAQRAWRCNNATALAVSIDIGPQYVETDN